MKVVVEGLQGTVAESTKVPTAVFTSDSILIDIALTYVST